MSDGVVPFMPAIGVSLPLAPTPDHAASPQHCSIAHCSAAHNTTTYTVGGGTVAIYTACIGILECDVVAGIECAHPYSASEAQ